jgi:hypothetical protein
LFHVVDLLPTIVEGIAGGHPLATAAPVDGVNLWDAITSGGPSLRNEILLELTPPAAQGGLWAKAIRMGDLKLIEGLPGCDPATAFGSLGCPMGWLTLNPDGSTNATENTYNVTNENPSMVWLFDLRVDPQVSDDGLFSAATVHSLTCPSLLSRRGKILHQTGAQMSPGCRLHYIGMLHKTFRNSALRLTQIPIQQETRARTETIGPRGCRKNCKCFWGSQWQAVAQSCPSSERQYMEAVVRLGDPCAMNSRLYCA